MPDEIEIELVDLANDEVCSDCLTLNDTYVCSLVTEYVQDAAVSGRIVPGGISCRWLYTFPTPVCGYQSITAAYSRNYPNPWRFTVELSDDAPSSGDSILFREFFGEKHSCRDLDALVVPFFSVAGSGAGACDPAGSFARATAL